MDDRQRLGSRAEALAAAHLRRAGWTILDRNFRFHHKEIDLVAEQDGVIIFVEVKARGGGGFGHPLDAVTARKRRDLRTAARGWIARHGRSGVDYRFDAISVQRTGRGMRLEHIEGAWG